MKEIISGENIDFVQENENFLDEFAKGSKYKVAKLDLGVSLNSTKAELVGIALRVISRRLTSEGANVVNFIWRKFRNFQFFRLAISVQFEQTLVAFPDGAEDKMKCYIEKTIEIANKLKNPSNLCVFIASNSEEVRFYLKNELSNRGICVDSISKEVIVEGFGLKNPTWQLLHQIRQLLEFTLATRMDGLIYNQQSAIGHLTALTIGTTTGIKPIYLLEKSTDDLCKFEIYDKNQDK